MFFVVIGCIEVFVNFVISFNVVFIMLDKLAADIEAQLRRLQKRRTFQDDGQSMGATATYEKPQNRMFCV